MASQGPVNVSSSGSLLKDLTAFEPSKLDTEHTCFSTKRKVQIVVSKSLPFLILAGLATLVSSFLLPPLGFALVAAGSFTLGTVASVYLCHKALSERKVRHVGVLPYINHHKVSPSQRNTLPTHHLTQPTAPRQTPPIDPKPASAPSGLTPSTGNHKKTPVQPQPVPMRDSTSPTAYEPAPTPQTVQIPTGKGPLRLSPDDEALLIQDEPVNEQPEPTSPDNTDSSSDSGVSRSTTPPSSPGVSDDLSDAYNVSPFSISPAHSVNEDMIITMPGTSLPGRPDTPGNSSDNWETSSIREDNPYSVPPRRERRGAGTPETEDSNASFQPEGVNPGAFSATDIQAGPLTPRSAAEVDRNIINQQLTRQTTPIHSLSDESAISAPRRSTSDRDSSRQPSPAVMPESTDDEDEDEGILQGPSLGAFHGSVTPLQSQRETGLSAAKEDNTSIRSERPISIEQTRPGSTLFPDENENSETAPLSSQTSGTASSYSVDRSIRHTESPQQALEEPATGSIVSPLSDEDSTRQNSPVLMGNLAETEGEQINPEPASGSLPRSFRPIPIREEIDLPAIEKDATSLQSEIPTSIEQTSSDSSLFPGENSEAVPVASHASGTSNNYIADQSTGHTFLPQEPSDGETTFQWPEVVATELSDNESNGFTTTPSSEGIRSTALNQEVFQPIEADNVTGASVATNDISETSLPGRLSLSGDYSDHHEPSSGAGSNSDSVTFSEYQREAEKSAAEEDSYSIPLENLSALKQARQSPASSSEDNDDAASVASSSPDEGSILTVNPSEEHHQSAAPSLTGLLDDDLESFPELAGSSIQQQATQSSDFPNGEAFNQEPVESIDTEDATGSIESREESLRVFETEPVSTPTSPNITQGSLEIQRPLKVYRRPTQSLPTQHSAPDSTDGLMDAKHTLSNQQSRVIERASPRPEAHQPARPLSKDSDLRLVKQQQLTPTSPYADSARDGLRPQFSPTAEERSSIAASFDKRIQRSSDIHALNPMDENALFIAVTLESNGDDIHVVLGNNTTSQSLQTSGNQQQLFLKVEEIANRAAISPVSEALEPVDLRLTLLMQNRTETPLRVTELNISVTRDDLDTLFKTHTTSASPLKLIFNRDQLSDLNWEHPALPASSTQPEEECIHWNLESVEVTFDDRRQETSQTIAIKQGDSPYNEVKKSQVQTHSPISAINSIANSSPDDAIASFRAENKMHSAQEEKEATQNSTPLKPTTIDTSIAEKFEYLEPVKYPVLLPDLQPPEREGDVLGHLDSASNTSEEDIRNSLMADREAPTDNSDLPEDTMVVVTHTDRDFDQSDSSIENGRTTAELYKKLRIMPSTTFVTHTDITAEYEDIITAFQTGGGNFGSYHIETNLRSCAFIQFRKKDTNPWALSCELIDLNKFHLSVAKHSIDNAFNAVKSLLFSTANPFTVWKMSNFPYIETLLQNSEKPLEPYNPDDPAHRVYYGAQFTFYGSPDDIDSYSGMNSYSLKKLKAMQDFIFQSEQCLRQANIQTGEIPTSDALLPNHQYITYRNENFGKYEQGDVTQKLEAQPLFQMITGKTSNLRLKVNELDQQQATIHDQAHFDDDRGEESSSSLIVSLAHDDTHLLPEPDFISGFSNTIGQSYSLPAFLGEKPQSRDRRALSLDGLNCGYLADIEDHSSDNSPTDSDSESNTGLINQQIRVPEAAEPDEQTDGMESEEKAQAFLTMLSTENDTLTSPEPDFEPRLFTTTEESRSLPTYTLAKQPSTVRSAFSLDRLSYGHWADVESSDTTPLLSPAASDFGLANRQTSVFSGTDHAAPDQIGAMTPHLFDPAVSKNKTSLDDKHKRIRGHASDPELTTQRKERLSGNTIPEQIAPHLPELSEFSSVGSFCITDAQELVSKPDSIDDSDMDDWEDLRDCAQELKPFKQELEDAINKPLVLLEYLAHQLAYNLDGKSQVELPGHSDGNQRHNVQKVQEVPPGLNAYILYPENSDTGKPVDLKLIFRGTNPYDASAIRDLEPSGAGFDTMEKAAKSITQQLHNILRHYPDRAVNLTITGHSLGGADAQNFFGHFLNPNISAIANETLTATPLLANIQKITLFTKCSAGVPEITHNRVISALNRLNGQQEHTGIKTEIFHLKVEGDIVQATGDCHVGSSLEQKIADVSILQIYPSNEASRVDRHTKKFFTDDANLAPIYWYTWVKNTTDKGMEDIRRSVRDTSRILRSYPIKGAQWAIHSAANYWFTPSEAMAETSVLKDTTIAEQPEESTPFTSIRAESDDISASHPASLVTHSSAETLKEDQKNNATIGTESKEASINNESSEVHLEDIHPMAYVNESDSDQISDAEHAPSLAISLPRGRKQKKLRLQNIIPPQLRKRPKSDLAIARAYDMSICFRLALCGNKETKRQDIKPYDRDNTIKIDFIRRMLVDEQSFVRACDPYNVIRDINADIEEEAKAEKRFRYSILAKAEVTDKSLRGEAFRDATRPVSEQAYWNFMARCQDDHSNTLDEESEPNKGVFKYSFRLIHKLACFNNEFGQIERDFRQLLFKELSMDDQKRLRSLLKRAGTLQKHAESCYQYCEQYNLEQKTIENILSKAVGSDSQNRQCKKLQGIQEGIRKKLNEKPKSDTPEVLQEINEADNEPVEPTTSSAYPDLQPENNFLAENNAHDTGMDDIETGVQAEVDDVISLTGDMSFDLSSDDPLLSEDENDPTKQPDSLTDEQKLALMQHQNNTGLQHLSPTDDDKLVISSADIPSATAMMGLYSDAQKALDGIHEQGKHREDANDVIKDVSRYMSTIQKYFSVDAFSLQAPPADAVREKMYSQLVDLGARYLILKTQSEASSRRTNYGKEELGISVEFLWQTQKAWKSASPDLINGQVAAMLAIGLMKPEQKTFVFEVCLNTQIISLEDIRRNIEQLKNKQDELSDRLKNTVSESNEQNELNERLLDIQGKLTTFEAQYSDLRSKESSGMKNQKDFLASCYSQLTHQLQEEISQGVEKYLRRYQKEYKKKPAEEIKKLKELSKSVIADSGPMLRRKAKEYANETSREKENEKNEGKGTHWKRRVKDERLKTLNKAVALLIDAEVLRQLCASDMDKACKVFSPDVISRLFNDQELTFNERSLPHIDSLNFFQILAENEKVDLMAEKKREDVNHQVQKDIEREAFSCHLKTADNPQSAFTHNDYLQEKSQLKATAFDGESPSEADLVQKSSARVLEKLTTAFKGLLKEAGVEEGERMEHLITTMLAHSHQGAYALHQGISEVIQSKLSLVIDACLPKAPNLDEMGPPRLVFPDQPSRKSNATLEIAQDVKGNNILLLSKVFEWDINLHDRELSPIPDARRRLRVETVYEVGLVEGSVKVRSINTSEVQQMDG
ncbi:hypothetical protein [Endozoicomonas atrinae]|uniref:hypothetical protein n=1 Tax=Endozoicomonas atrinae TaxID=1333660 RepID=UPI0008267BC1|nr:hypothetical protein [Endozoicomonas atrinae]